MCDMCDDPTLTYADVRARRMAAIDEYGWQLQYVEADEAEPSLLYTVGLTGHGLPELCAVGLPLEWGPALMSDVAQAMIDRQVRVGSSVQGPAGRLFRLVPQKDTSELLVARDTYGGRVRALALRPQRKRSSKRA
jgi:hypothetical protein